MYLNRRKFLVMAGSAAIIAAGAAYLFSDRRSYIRADSKKDYSHFIDNKSKEYHWLNEQTIEANRIQAYRDDAQSELGDWIRFSTKY